MVGVEGPGSWMCRRVQDWYYAVTVASCLIICICPRQGFAGIYELINDKLFLPKLSDCSVQYICCTALGPSHAVINVTPTLHLPGVPAIFRV